MASIPDFVWNFMVGAEGRGLDLTSSDPGNWTGGAVGSGVLRGSKYGISAAIYPSIDIANLTEVAAQAIFDRDYWSKIGCDRLHPALGFLVVDAEYNGGQPIRWMQQAVGTVIDGDFGDDTERAATLAMASNPTGVVATFAALHLGYLAICRLWPIDGVDADGRPLGWVTRLTNALALAVSVAVAPASPLLVN